MNLHKLFIVKVFRQSRFLVIVFLLLLSFNMYINYRGIETTPFFIFSMYAGKMTPQPQYKMLTITYNNDQPVNFPHTWQEPQAMMLYYTLSHYRKMDQNNMTDPMNNAGFNRMLARYRFLNPVSHNLINQPTDIAGYFAWLKKYTESIVNTPVKSISVFEKTIHYNALGRVVEDNSELLYSIK